MMNKFDLSERIDAAYHPAIDRTRRVLVAQSFALALSDFIEDEFKALAEVNVDFSANASFLISADYTALFFRNLFYAVRGRAYLKIDITSGGNTFIMKVDTDSVPLVALDGFRDMIRTVRDAGFEIYPEKYGFRLEAQLSESFNYSIYAVSLKDNTSFIRSRLEEIFSIKK